MRFLDNYARCFHFQVLNFLENDFKDILCNDANGFNLLSTFQIYIICVPG